MAKDTYSIDAIKDTDRYKAVVESGRYDVTDELVNSQVCNLVWCYEKADELREILDTQGIMVDGLHGKKQSPMVGAYKATLQMANSLLDQLRKVGAEKPAEETDPLADFNA